MSLPPDIVNAVNNNDNLIVLVEIDWPGGTVYVHNRVGEKRWDNQTWIGVGQLGRIGQKEDGKKTGRTALSLQVTNPDLLAEARKDDAVARAVKIYLGALDTRNRITSASRILYKFIMGVELHHDDVTTINLQLGSHRERSHQPKDAYRMTAATHRNKYPDDSYLDDVEAIAKGPLSSYSGSQAVGGTGAYTGGQGGGWEIP